MRDYGKVAPQFWTGDTGKFLRSCGRDTQVVALYLITCPSSSMIGLYYLPLPTLCHEVGISREGALKALRRASEGGFCQYDEASELVWVPEMAKFQIGDSLDARDNRVKGVLRELNQFRKSRFYNEFHDRYGAAYNLGDMKPLASPLEAPCKPLRSHEQEQEQDQEQEDSPHPPLTPAPTDSPTHRPSPAVKANGRLWGKPPIQYDPNSRAFVGITEADRSTWGAAYPAVDLDRELAAMIAWIAANPAKARKSNYGRFIASWLSRQQDRGGGLAPATARQQAAGPRFEPADEWLAGDPLQSDALASRTTHRTRTGTKPP